MARIVGTYNRAYNNEVTIPAPIDARTLVETYEDLTTLSNWVTSDNRFIAFNGLVVSVTDVNDKTNTRNGLYLLFDPNADPANWEDPDVTKKENWHKLADMSDLASFVEKLSLFETKLNNLADTELFQKINTIADLPKDFASEDFNPNITYYIYSSDTNKLITYRYVKEIPGYMRASEAGSSTNISRVEINSAGELVIYYSDGTSNTAGTVVGRDGSTTAIKIGDTIYTHTNGVIELPGFATIDYVDAKFVTKEDLEKANYATKDYVEDSIEDSFTDFTESFKTTVLWGGDSNPLDD
jgi:hypothetical protein